MEGYTPLAASCSVGEASDDGLSGEDAVFRVVVCLTAEILIEGCEDLGGGLLGHDAVVGVVVVGGDLVEPVVSVAGRALAAADVEPVVAADFVVDDLDNTS